MPPEWITALADSELFIQAGLAGAVMIFVLALIALLGYVSASYISQRDKEWRHFLTQTNQGFMSFLRKEMRSEREARGTAHGERRDDMKHLTAHIRENSAAINALAQAIGRHDRKAVDRWGKIMSRLGRIEGVLLAENGSGETKRDARLEIIRQHDRENREREARQ